jgi:hypothetical protein
LGHLGKSANAAPPPAGHNRHTECRDGAVEEGPARRRSRKDVGGTRHALAPAPRREPNRARRPVVTLLRSVLAAVLCAGIVWLGTLAAERGLWKAAASGDTPQQIDVVLRGDVIDPSVMLLLPGRVRFVIRNTSGAARVFSITGPGVAAATPAFDNGETAHLDVTFARPGTYVAGDGRDRTAEGSIQVRLP